MQAHPVLKNATIGLISGYLGARAMDRVTTKLSELEPAQAREQEKRVSPGIPYDIAAQDLAARVGIQLSETQQKALGSAFHVGLGLAGGEMYMALRKGVGIGPVASALVVSLGLFLGIDEGLTPAMRWSAPNAAYPPATHLRGLAGHLTLGATTGVAAELLSRLME